ncbi:XRE family transcriptional regulator [Streptomyces sp. NEAU-S77]|uniref:XRE family transcriptional regulator n=1 Tax=Streptomyces sp. NEAU-S77 TaxID=3411033 RepID=UPI003BA2B7F4
MDELIGHPLAYARKLKGLSQAGLAFQMRYRAKRRQVSCGTTRQRVSLWEQWRGRPSKRSQMLIGDALEVPEELVFAFEWPLWLPGYETLPPLGAGLTVSVLREAIAMDLDRRTFMAHTAAALTTIAHQWATTSPARIVQAERSRRVDPEVLDWIETTARQLNSLATAQRQNIAHILIGFYRDVVDLLENAVYSDTDEVRLHTLAATLAQTIAWHRFDHQHHTAATSYWNAALHSAHQAQATDLGAGVIADIAYQSVWLDQPATAVGSLSHALTRATDPTARSLLHLRRARAHAMLGTTHARACYRDLAAAEHHLTTATTDPPPWCAWMSSADLAVDTGRCLSLLGQPRQADRQITQGIARLPESRTKTKAIFYAYQADSLLSQGDVDQAAVTAHQAVQLAQPLGASRCIQQISDLVPRFTAHTNISSVEHLLHNLAEHTRPPTTPPPSPLRSRPTSNPSRPGRRRKAATSISRAPAPSP